MKLTVDAVVLGPDYGGGGGHQGSRFFFVTQHSQGALHERLQFVLARVDRDRRDPTYVFGQ